MRYGLPTVTRSHAKTDTRGSVSAQRSRQGKRDLFYPRTRCRCGCFQFSLSRTSDLEDPLSQFKTRLAALNLPKTIPVGTGDAGKEIDPTLVVGIDFVSRISGRCFLNAS